MNPEPDGYLSAILVFPVKSLRGVRLDRAMIRGGRLVDDRNWVLVDEADRFLHQRDYPHMARLATELTPGGVVVHCDRLPPLHLAAPTAAAVRHVRLWRRAAAVTPMPAADAWFREALGMRCHLMAFNPATEGLDVPWYEQSSSLQDATPFHLASESSLQDLNHRIGAAAAIPIERFRPNIVVGGTAPWAEDHWREFRVGAIGFTWVRPCTRCAITTTDHVTGERSREPLRTLSRFRRDGSAVTFGHYVVAQGDGELAVGQVVRVTSRPLGGAAMRWVT